MTIFEKIKSMNIDEFAEWFEENCLHDNDPCIKWWDETYCKKCGSVYTTVDYLELYTPYNKVHECAWCEAFGNCKYFQDMSEIPSNKEIIKMYLENEVG